MPGPWEIINPFKVVRFGPFVKAAEAAGFRRMFKLNQTGYVFCVPPEEGYDVPSLEQLYQLLQAHLPPREYALVRIEHIGGGELEEDGNVLHTDDHTRYEKVYRDRVEPSVYSDDPFHRR